MPPGTVYLLNIEMIKIILWNYKKRYQLKVFNVSGTSVFGIIQITALLIKFDSYI